MTGSGRLFHHLYIFLNLRIISNATKAIIRKYTRNPKTSKFRMSLISMPKRYPIANNENP